MNIYIYKIYDIYVNSYIYIYILQLSKIHLLFTVIFMI